MYSPDLLEALRRGAHNFPPGHEHHLQQQEKSPVTAESQRSPSSVPEAEAERPVLVDGANLQNVPKLHFKPPESRGVRRTSATCLSVLRRAVAGVRRCGSSVLGTEGAVQQRCRRSPGKRCEEEERRRQKRDP